MDYQIRSSEYQQKSIRGELKPLQKISLGYKHYTQKQFLAPISQFPPNTSEMSEDIFNGDYILSVPLVKNGRIRYQERAQKHLTFSLEFNKKRLQETLIFQTKRLFYGILGAKKLLGAVEFSKKVVKRQKEDLEAMFQEGKVTQVDLLKVKVREATLQESIIKIKNQINILKENILNLMGKREDIENFKVAGILPEKCNSPFSTKQSAYKKAIRVRKDLHSLNEKIKAQKNKIKTIVAQLKGELNLKGYYSLRYNKDGDNGELAFLGISYDILLSEGGRIKEKIKAERSILKSLLEKKKALLLQIKKEVDNAFYDIESSKKRIEAYREAVVQAKESMRIEKEKYDAGKSPIREFLDAQDDYLKTEANLTSAVVSLASSIAELEYYVGIKIKTDRKKEKKR